MIRIVADFDHLVKETDGVIISKIADYVPAYARVLEASVNKEDLTVYIQLPAVEHWFRQMSERYQDGSFVFERIDARKRLEQLWGIPVPETVAPSDIVEAGLLDLEIEPNLGDQFDDVLLEVFYDPVYTGREFPFSKLVDLLDAYDEKKWKRNERVRLAYRAYSNRLEGWKTRAKSQERQELINRIASDPDSLRRGLMRYKVLQSYKELGHKLMGRDYALFEALNLNLIQLPVDERSVPEVVTQVTYVLKGFDQPASKEEMQALIACVSGYLMVEFEIIEGAFRKSPELLTSELVHVLEDKFEPLQHRLGKSIARLRGLVRPEKPSTPDKTWDLEHMLDWATQKYLPYQSWCDANGIVDETLYALADVFAEWLYDNWHELHANSRRLVFNVLPNHARLLKQDGSVNLILVIDNLGWTLVSTLQDLFQEHGFYRKHAEPYLSMLPSETEISKKCLLAGSPTYQGIDNKSYTAIIEKGWVPYFNTAEFRYLSDPGKLDSLRSIDAQTYVVNYRAVDTALHMSSAQLGLPHHQHIHNLLVGFVETVVDFVKRHDLENKVKIHIVTDHGSMRIPEQVPNELDRDNFKGPDFPNTSHRYVAVSNTRFEKLPDNLRADCFFISSTEFGNPVHYLCARRASRFLATNDTFYVHGGLSPEEVVVPYLVFEAEKVLVQDLTALLVRNQFRYRTETVELELGNPNEYAAENIYITTLNSNFEMEPQKVEWLNQQTKVTLHLRGLFKQTPNPEERTSLSFLIRYECHGEKHTQTVKLPIEMRAMVELRDTSIFDDLD